MSNDKLDKIAEDIHEIKITLAKQHVSLEHHIKRSDAIEAKLEPVESKLNMAMGALALIGLLSTIAGIVVAFK